MHRVLSHQEGHSGSIDRGITRFLPGLREVVFYLPSRHPQRFRQRCPTPCRAREIAVTPPPAAPLGKGRHPSSVPSRAAARRQLPRSLETAVKHVNAASEPARTSVNRLISLHSNLRMRKNKHNLKKKNIFPSQSLTKAMAVAPKPKLVPGGHRPHH